MDVGGNPGSQLIVSFNKIGGRGRDAKVSNKTGSLVEKRGGKPTWDTKPLKWVRSAKRSRR